MNNVYNVFLAFTFLLGNAPWNRTIHMAQTKPSEFVEPDSGSVVCAPGVYETIPDDCLALGPSETLANMAVAGIPFPIQPLPAFTPLAELNDIPFRYFRVIDEGAPLFGTLEDAANNQPYDRLAPGFLYVSYVGLENDQNGGAYYRLRSGVLVGADGGRVGVPIFQGLAFSSQPRNAFGWVLGETNPRTSPGLNSPQSGKTYYRYHVVQIYDTQEASNLTWNLVGPNQWVDSREISRVDPHNQPPEGVTVDRWIEINLFEQTISVYDHGQLVFATLVSSGVNPFWTRPGIFQIYEKKPTETMSGATEADRSDYYYLEDVPWTMYFDEKRALHGAYWHNGFGYARSHGCVNLSIGDSHWLFDWANIGDTVYVYDPSGLTPTDPSLYGNGGY